MSVCRMMIKCADISNPTREWKLCYEWALRIVEEVSSQLQFNKINKPFSTLSKQPKKWKKVSHKDCSIKINGI